MGGSSCKQNAAGVRVAIVGTRRLVRLGLSRALERPGIEATPVASEDLAVVATGGYDVVVYDGVPPANGRSAARAAGIRVIVLADRDASSGSGDLSLDRARGIDGLVTAILEPDRPVRRRWVAPSLGPPPLTDRENQVLRLVARGLSAPSIAAELDVSARTVQRHKERIVAKLGAKNQSDAVAIALRHGLVALDGASRR